MPGPGGGWRPLPHPPETATAAGSTHPTGMHSCYNIRLEGGKEDFSNHSDSQMNGEETSFTTIQCIQMVSEKPLTTVQILKADTETDAEHELFFF